MGDRLIDIARRVDDDSVRNALRIAYSDMPEHGIEKEIDALRSLRAKTPADPEGFTLRISLSEPEQDEVAWIHVDATKEGDPQAYSLSASPWSLWAALPIRLVNLDMTEAQIIAHVLWEMTFHGDEDETAAFFAELGEQIDEIKDCVDHDPGDCCPNCGGDGVIYSCFDECACVDPESGCDECERACDWCKPRPAPPKAEG